MTADLRTATSPPALSTAVPSVALSIPDTAASLGVGKSTVWEWVAEGLLPVVKVGRRTMILTADRDEFLLRRRVLRPGPGEAE